MPTEVSSSESRGAVTSVATFSIQAASAGVASTGSDPEPITWAVSSCVTVNDLVIFKK